MFADHREWHLFTAGLARHFQYVDELIDDVGAWPHSELARALEWTVFLPLLYAPCTKQLSTIIAFLRFTKDFKTNSADQLISQFLVHKTIMDPVELVASRVVSGRPIRIVVHRDGLIHIKTNLIIRHTSPVQETSAALTLNFFCNFENKNGT